MTGPGTEFSFPFSLDEDGRWRLDDQESSWLFVEWFVVKKNGMIFSKDDYCYVHFDRFIYSSKGNTLTDTNHAYYGRPFVNSFILAIDTSAQLIVNGF